MLVDLYLKYANHFYAASISCEWDRFITPAAAVPHTDSNMSSHVGSPLLDCWAQRSFAVSWIYSHSSSQCWFHTLVRIAPASTALFPPLVFAPPVSLSSGIDHVAQRLEDANAGP